MTLLGVVVLFLGLIVAGADEGESLSVGTLVPLLIVLAIVAYAAWFAKSGGRRPSGPEDR